ncbi:MAG TPA: thiamine-phosphate kinase [Acidimicrobiales bacterium]|nr:thiamine-phosphate kinase [Acidimicrobiales bacterium]
MSRLVEDETLQRIRSALESGTQDVDLTDDAAVVWVPGGGPLVLSVDSVVEGVHVDLAFCNPRDIGWKALMGALSDLAAMGARPLGALVALCVPPGVDAVAVMEGVGEAAGVSGCLIVGGDVSSSGQLVVTVTVMGTVEDGGTAVARSGARAGDVVFVTGPCGASAAGLRLLRAGQEAGSAGQAYRRPVARLAEGEVARRAGARAMIDVSDGLALDLHRLADRSGVGFELDAVPVGEGAALDEALGGGEDYELVVVMGPTEVEEYLARSDEAGLRPPIRIGVIRADAGVRRLAGEALPTLGWQHPLDDGSAS